MSDHASLRIGLRKLSSQLFGWENPSADVAFVLVLLVQHACCWISYKPQCMMVVGGAWRGRRCWTWRNPSSPCEAVSHSQLPAEIMPVLSLTLTSSQCDFIFTQMCVCVCVRLTAQPLQVNVSIMSTSQLPAEITPALPCVCFTSTVFTSLNDTVTSC